MKLDGATFEQKVSYLKGRLYSAGEGEQLQQTNTKMFFNVVDAAGHVEKTGTIDALIYWIDKNKGV